MFKEMKNVISVSVVAICAIGFTGQVYAQSQSQPQNQSQNQSLSQSLSDRYELQAGDRIYIQVFDEPDLTMQATVGQSGAINYSYLGTVEVAGKSPEQLTDDITAKLRDGYLKNPSVNITVEQYRSFFVDGEVKRPGSYVYEPGLTLAKAVTLAGGMTDRASERKIFLTRDADGDKKSRTRVNMSQPIEPGDVIEIGERFF